MTMFLYFAEFEQRQRKLNQMQGIKAAKGAGRFKGRKSKITKKMLVKAKTLINEKQNIVTGTAKIL